MKNTTNILSPVIRVTRSWGSHGYSMYGVYYERWRESLSEEMSEADYIRQSAEFAFDARQDKREMRDNESRPIFHLKREDAR